MQLIMNMLIKPAGYRKALKTYLESNTFKKTPFLEWSNPKMGTGVRSRQPFNRIFEIKDDNVCAKITDFKVEDLIARITIEPFGPKAHLIDANKKYALAARMLKDNEVVQTITTFDLVPIEDHIEYIGE